MTKNCAVLAGGREDKELHVDRNREEKELQYWLK
jgi:hypothetical protein